MSSRKKFADLSKRQKLRRLADEFENDMNELDSELDISNILPSTETNIVNETVSDAANLISIPLSIGIDNTEEAIEINLKINQENVPVTSDMHNKFNVFLSTLDIDDDYDDDYDSDDEVTDSDFDYPNEILDEDYFSDEEDNEMFDLKKSLRAWYISCGTIGRDNMSNLLKMLNKAGHNELPNDTRALVGTPLKTIITPCEPGEYFHYGLKLALTDILSREILGDNIEIDINVDGLPITKSTKRTLWPIQGKIVGNRYTTPFVIGIYHGTKKPDSITTYLTPFINEFKELNLNGIMFRNKHYTVSLRCIICDTPARSFCLCTKQFNGYFGCGKCTEEGDFIKNRMVFLNESAPLRTNESFRNRSQEEHHHGISPFEALSIDMVKQFLIDYMHLVCLGVTKLLIKLWLKITPKLSCDQTARLSMAFTDLGKYVPVEFNRKPQCLTDLGHWKATVFRFFFIVRRSNYTW